MQMPLAAQMRQVARETEPEEIRLLKRYSPIRATLIRATYGPGGLVEREVSGPFGVNQASTWISAGRAEQLLIAHQAAEEVARLVRRSDERLGHHVTEAQLPTLGAEDMRILRMSAAEWERFRSQQGGAAQAAAGGAAPAAQVGPAQGAAQAGP